MAKDLVNIEYVGPKTEETLGMIWAVPEKNKTYSVLKEEYERKKSKYWKLIEPKKKAVAKKAAPKKVAKKQAK